jgi:hypothetical protein
MGRSGFVEKGIMVRKDEIAFDRDEVIFEKTLLLAKSFAIEGPMEVKGDLTADAIDLVNQWQWRQYLNFRSYDTLDNNALDTFFVCPVTGVIRSIRVVLEGPFGSLGDDGVFFLHSDTETSAAHIDILAADPEGTTYVMDLDNSDPDDRIVGTIQAGDMRSLWWGYLAGAPNPNWAMILVEFYDHW